MNKSKGFIISDNSDIADSFSLRFLGLMFSVRRDLVLAAPKEDIQSSSIHMFFMRFPIGVIWLNSDMVVVDIKKKVPQSSLFNIKTWRIYKPRQSATYTIELGLGEIKGTEVGDEIEFLE